jgi:hypothetical protein
MTDSISLQANLFLLSTPSEKNREIEEKTKSAESTIISKLHFLIEHPIIDSDPEEMFKIPAHLSLQVMNKCSLFQNNVTFLVSPYWVQSSVSLRIGRECDQDQDH